MLFVVPQEQVEQTLNWLWIGSALKLLELRYLHSPWARHLFKTDSQDQSNTCPT